MAHFVQEKSLELVPVWTVVKENKLLTKDELKSKIGKLRKLEEDFQRQGRDMKDLVELINYLVGLVKQLEETLKGMEIHNKKAIRKTIRVNFLAVVGSRFEVGRRHFNAELEFWRYWVNTYINLGWFDSVGDVYQKSIETLGQTNPTIWIEASFYPLQYKGTKGILDCRRKILECIRFHPNNIEGYVAWFQLELTHRKMLDAELQDSVGKGTEVDLMRDSDKSLKALHSIIKSGRANAAIGENPKFYIRLMSLNAEVSVKEFHELMTHIQTNFEEACAAFDETYTFLALVFIDPKYEGDVLDQQNIRKCFAMFHKGTKSVEESKRKPMYSSFIAAHYKILDLVDDNRPLLHIVLDNLRNVYAEAHVLDFLTLNDYKAWINTVKTLSKDGQKPGDWKEWITYSDNQIVGLLSMETDDTDEPLEKRMRETESADSEKEEEEDEGQSFVESGTYEDTFGLGEVIDTALKKFPLEASFIHEKMNFIIGNPLSSAAQFYKKDDVGERIVAFLEEYGKVKMDEEQEYPIWRDALLRIVFMDGWTSSRISSLIKMTTGKLTIQRRLAMEFIKVLWTSIDDVEEKMAKRKKFLKRMARLNKKPKNWVDEEMHEFLKKLDTLFPITPGTYGNATRSIWSPPRPMHPAFPPYGFGGGFYGGYPCPVPPQGSQGLYHYGMQGVQYPPPYAYAPFPGGQGFPYGPPGGQGLPYPALPGSQDPNNSRAPTPHPSQPGFPFN